MLEQVQRRWRCWYRCFPSLSSSLDSLLYLCMPPVTFFSLDSPQLLGAIELGAFISVFLFGAIVVQGHFYLTHCKNDSKILVSFVSPDVLKQVLFMVDVFSIYNPLVLTRFALYCKSPVEAQRHFHAKHRHHHRALEAAHTAAAIQIVWSGTVAVATSYSTCEASLFETVITISVQVSRIEIQTTLKWISSI